MFLIANLTVAALSYEGQLQLYKFVNYKKQQTTNTRETNNQLTKHTQPTPANTPQPRLLGYVPLKSTNPLYSIENQIYRLI